MSPSRPVSPEFLTALRGSHEATFRARVVETFQTGTNPSGTVIPLIDGDVQLDGTAAIRSTVDCTTDGTAMWPTATNLLLAPYGNELFVERGVNLGGGGLEWVSLGYFRIDTPEQDQPPDGPIRISGKDRMSGIIDGRLLAPRQYLAAETYGDIVDDLILDVYPSATVIWDDATDTNLLNRDLIVEEDRYGFLNDLITSLGKIWYWNHRGELVVIDPPDPTTAVFDVNHGTLGVLVEMSRHLTREGVYNAVVASGEAVDTEAPVRAAAVDADPASPTYFAGSFGPVPRFFCVDAETEALTRSGWKRHDALNAGDDVLTLDTESGLAEWEPVDAVNRFEVSDQDLVSMTARGHSSLTTVDHRWPVERYNSSRDTWSGAHWRTSSTLLNHERLYAAAPVVGLPSEPKWSDAFVELVGWYWTEGTDHFWQGEPSGGVTIYQSRRVNPDYCARIRACLTAAFGPESKSLLADNSAGFDWSGGLLRWREARMGNNDMSYFRLNQYAGRILKGVAPDKVIAPDFIASLTLAQLHLLWSTSVDADGHRKGRFSEAVSQRRKDRLDSLQMVCTLAGFRTNLYRLTSTRYQLEGIEMWQLASHHSSRAHLVSMPRKVVRYTGTVWCPTTRNGTWLARRNGTVYFTGNSSPFLITEVQAASAAASILRRSTGLPYSIDFGAVANPALEPYDPVRVSYSDAHAPETHILQRLTIPLIPRDTMTAATRQQAITIVGAG